MALHRRLHAFLSFMDTSALVPTILKIASCFLAWLQYCCRFFTRTQMGSSLYELNLELFEDVDSEVGNYFIVGAWTDIFVSPVLVDLRGIFPSIKANSSKFQFHLRTVDKQTLPWDVLL